MNNEFYEHKKSDKVKWIMTLIAFLIVGVVLAAVITQGFQTATPWEKQDKEHEHHYEDDICTECGDEQPGQTAGAVIGESEGVGVSLLSEKIAKADYAANGVSPLAKSAYTLTATVEPSNAVNKAVDWSVSFVNPSSSWATGKTVTDYVTVTPTSDGALTATVQCLQAFGEQIKVTVTHRNNENATASCTVDFAKKLEGVRFYNDSYFDFTIGEDEEAFHPSGESLAQSPDLEFLYSDYTLEDSFDLTLKAEIDPNFLSAYKDAVPDEVGVQVLMSSRTYSFNGNAFLTSYLDKNYPFYFYPDEMAFINLGDVTGKYAQLVFGGNDECHNAIGTIIEENPSYYYYDLTLTATGTYSSFTDTIRIVPDRENYEFVVRSLSLNNSSLVF